ncbi:MAG: alpha/beta hydrolase fold protein [Solirubrobacterales bacterium]|nr:alpha/beta hydrolase fold protein [Solirubrobacterales bacterium]
MRLLPSPERLGAAAANAYDATFKGGLADLRPTPARIIDEGPKRTIFRYLDRDEGRRATALPVLLVPPLAAPAICFDLRRGCSMAEHMLGLGHPTYLLDYGAIAYSDKDLGLEHWVDDILPTAIRKVSEDAGGRPVQLVGWCLGGIMSLLAVAGDRHLPVNSVALVASPFDFATVRLFAPIRGAASVTNGMLGTALYRLLGGAPAPLVKRAFQLTSIDKYVMRPLAVASNLHDREWLAQVEAVDAFMNQMHAYPGRTMGQLYHQFFRVNELAGGTLELGDRTIDLAEVRVPVLSVAGQADVLAPKAAVQALEGLLPNAPQVRMESAPGGHLGVLTGRSAARTTWAFLDDFLGEHTPRAGRGGLRVVA